MTPRQIPQPPVLSGHTRYTFKTWRGDHNRRMRFSKLWYWLKCRLWYRYNVVVVQTCPPTWQDRSEFLLDAVMQILTDFVEKEKPFEMIDTTYQTEVYESIDEIYRWWHVGRPAREAHRDDVLTRWHDSSRHDGPAWDSTPSDRTKVLWQLLQELDAAADREDEEMLIRVIKLRSHLWT